MITRRESMSLLGASALGLSAASALAADSPPRTTADSMDPLFTQPYIDIDEWRDKPERHRYVHGGFKTTELRFSMYFPPKEKYEGRFFHPVMHIAGNENAASGRLAGMDGDSLGFAFASGGYLVESNMGSLTMAGPEDITNWRASAATAQYSRQLAQQMYGGGRPYGYVYGGSGGAFKSTACAEHTQGVWDGAVPFIAGSPIAIPNVFTVQAHALRVLEGKFEGIVDALEPGGSGDMYAGLNDEQREALREVTGMGFPPRAWFAHERISVSYTGVFASIIYQLLNGDPAYANDFWTKPGYLGTNPTPSLQAARVQYKTTLTGMITTGDAKTMGLPVSIAAGTRNEAPSAIRLANLPQKRLEGAYITIGSGAAAGQKAMVTGVAKDLVMIGFNDTQIPVLAQMRAGDEVEIDNSVYLAVQTFHRHQTPPADFYVWEQFRNPDGSPKYVQRPLLPGYRTREAVDRVQSGRFSCKMIVMECLMDEAAYPWQADWYRNRVREHLGAKIDESYRLWYVDHAMHVSPGSYLAVSEGGNINPGYTSVDTHIISYSGVLQQALRDVVAWAEKGIAPPQSTTYKVEGGQLTVPPTAGERKGIQPVVTLTVNGGARADVRVGQSIKFEAVAEAPTGTGSIVLAQWDFDGSGAFPEHSEITPKSKITVSTTHTFTKPGTYFPVVRVASHRKGDMKTSYALARNLARVRVVVSA
jgi:hypothetical protein